jgi:hypothetical protein
MFELGAHLIRRAGQRLQSLRQQYFPQPSEAQAVQFLPDAKQQELLLPWRALCSKAGSPLGWCEAVQTFPFR